MAATIARATGYDKSGRVKETHRLGSQAARVEAATWRTSVSAEVYADGSGYVTVLRDGKSIGSVDFGPEDSDPVAILDGVIAELRGQ